MQILEAQYEIVTPMFIGGGDSQEPPELRPPSIKGALRFWWRALHWGQCLQNNAGDVQSALKQLHRDEAELFGAAANDMGHGQGKVMLKVIKPQDRLKISKNNAVIENPSSGQTYLLGQGLYHFKDGFLRQAISPQQSFNIVLKLDNGTDATGIINALLIFGLLGGLGSRSRKGFGSIAIRSIKHTNAAKQDKQIDIPDNPEQYKQAIKALLKQLPDSLPPFSAFSTQTRIDVSATAYKANQLLTEIGNEMQMYRSYGQKNGSEHKVNGKPAEQNFTFDHDVVFDFIGGTSINQHPQRLIFGLPHNYFFSGGDKADVDAENFSRRASPLIIHIHQFTNGQCMGVQCLLKADFLPDGERIQLKKGYKTQAIKSAIDWAVITTYLDRFTQGERIL